MLKHSREPFLLRNKTSALYTEAMKQRAITYPSVFKKMLGTRGGERQQHSPSTDFLEREHLAMQERQDQRAIILTALPVEYLAVRAYLKNIREEVHPQGTVYERGTFAGKDGEWDVVIGEIGMGGLNAALEAERILQAYTPDVALFVGVAGGLKDVERGDVVVATKVYGYEAGKEGPGGFESRPSIGSSTYRMEQRARAEARKSDWLERLADVPSPAPKVYVGPLAAGEKIIAEKSSAIYQFLKKHYTDALAVEMEGHGFLHATHAGFPVEALIVRGISDRMDDKNPVSDRHFQHRAAQHASAFAFEILAKVELGEGKRSRSMPARFGAAFPEVWNVSRRHKPFFTGRSHILKRLHDGFTVRNEAGMIYPQALNGLGGIGKTQTAAEYAYQHRADYTAVFWVNADTQENLTRDFTTIARMLKRSEETIQDAASLLHTMMEWFMEHTGWLLILDNADELRLVDPFLPMAARGHILLTTRAQAVRALAQEVDLERLDPQDGALCILRRSGLLRWDGRLGDAKKAHVETATTLSRLMDGLPLALEQAGAYTEETGCGLQKYLELYEDQQYRPQIQQMHSGPVPDYPESVARAWNVSRNAVHYSNPAAMEILSLCAFLAPDAMPEEILTRGAPALGPVLQAVGANKMAFDIALGVLRKYSLINRDVEREADVPHLSIHRLLQDVQRNEMDEATQRLWAERAVSAVNLALPFVAWHMMQPQVRNCVQLVRQWNIQSSAAENLVRKVEQAAEEQRRA
jgi:nucleoside phosphorylase